MANRDIYDLCVSPWGNFYTPRKDEEMTDTADRVAMRLAEVAFNAEAGDSGHRIDIPTVAAALSSHGLRLAVGVVVRKVAADRAAGLTHSKAADALTALLGEGHE